MTEDEKAMIDKTLEDLENNMNRILLGDDEAYRTLERLVFWSFHKGLAAKQAAQADLPVIIDPINDLCP